MLAFYDVFGINYSCKESIANAFEIKFSGAHLKTLTVGRCLHTGKLGRNCRGLKGAKRIFLWSTVGSMNYLPKGLHVR